MKTLQLSPDGQATVLACSSLAATGESKKPLSPAEWHAVTVAMRTVELRPRDLLGTTSATALREALGLDSGLADRLAALLARGGQLGFEVERLAERGIWIVTRADDSYPVLFKQRLGRQMPPVLYGAGSHEPLQSPSIAIVGSRDADPAALDFARQLAARCVDQGYGVVSGAARGVDSAAMSGALDRGGSVIGVTAEPLERLVRRGELRAAIAQEQLTLVTPYLPSARWHAGNAMARNRLIYAMAQAAVVAASSPGRGGTRAGALENLTAGWVPLHVRADDSPGARELIRAGGVPLRAGVSVEELDVSRLVARPPSLLDGNGAAERPVRRRDDAARETDDVFVAVWPILARHLQSPRTEQDVAEVVGLERTQARAWLKRATAEGHLEVRGRPKRYVLRRFAEQLSLADD